MKIIETKKLPMAEIDDREPTERVADELVTMTNQLTDAIKQAIKLLEKLGRNAKPTEWVMEVTSRDSRGMIENVKLTATENKVLLQ